MDEFNVNLVVTMDVDKWSHDNDVPRHLAAEDISIGIQIVAQNLLRQTQKLAKVRQVND